MFTDARRGALIVWVSFMFACALPAHAQHECGTELHESDITAAIRTEAAGMYQLADGLAAAGAVVVPLSFHVVNKSDGTGGLPVARQDQALVDANIAFAQMGIQFCKPGPTVYINSDDSYFNINTLAELNALRQTNPVAGTINVYFTEFLAIESGNICGMSAFTYSAVQGIVMKNECTATSVNHSTFPHELGHYFDLFHTHETAFGASCANGSNCATTGDKLCDTPADPGLNTTTVSTACMWIGNQNGPCAGDVPYMPDVRNIMSSSRPLCRDHFSAQQNAKGLATLLNLRPELVNNCSQPCPGDVNGDRIVNIVDVLAVISAWGAVGSNSADVDGNGVVNVGDLLAVIASWGSCN